MADQDGRRAAERAARETLGARIGAVGDLGAAVARRENAAAGPARARAQADELVAAARAEGRRLADAVRAEVAAADEHYATVYAAAIAAGWSADDLAGLGYPPPARRRARTRPDTDGGADSGQPDAASGVPVG
jgi:hypothetical protein